MLLIYIIFKPFKIYQKKKKTVQNFKCNSLSEKNTKIPFVLPNFANAILDFMMTILITQKIK